MPKADNAAIGALHGAEGVPGSNSGARHGDATRGDSTEGVANTSTFRDECANAEVRSHESEFVGGLWHLDFHHCSRKLIMPDGELLRPLLLGILDDHSRLCCHAQWYLDETAENLVHGLCQAFQKRGLPRELMSDNGSAMTADETEQGLLRLGILQSTTLPYSPYQNGKQEVFWVQVEGRLVAMLEGIRELSLPQLNQATQAWVEMEYNRTVHSEIGQTPLQRFIEHKDVGRSCPSSDELRVAFTAEIVRTQRRSDGTVSIAGVRFEIPSRYRHLLRLRLRYASWDEINPHLLCSTDFDSRHILTVVLCGDNRLCDKFRSPDMLPIGSRIRARLSLDYAPTETLRAIFLHLLEEAGNPSLMSAELITTLCEHAAGNFRTLMIMSAELLAAAVRLQRQNLDEKLFFEVFTRPPERRSLEHNKRNLAPRR